jgi:hypothetical protein
MDKFFSTFGKAVLVILLLALLIGGGVYIGLKLNKSPSQTASSTQTPSTSQPTPVQNSPAQNQVPATSTPMVSVTQTVNAGGFGTFPKYTINISSGWQQEKTTNNSQDLLTVSNGQYQIQINQTNMGNGECSYPGASPAPMSQQYTTFVSLAYNGDSNFYRRSKSQIPYPNGEDQYAICQKNSANAYSFVTTFGSILYMVPITPDNTMLSQMDQMVLSIQKQ